MARKVAVNDDGERNPTARAIDSIARIEAGHHPEEECFRPPGGDDDVFVVDRDAVLVVISG